MSNTETACQIRAPHPERDREAVFDLVSKTFRHPYFIMNEYCRREYFTDPSFDWAASRIGVMDDRVVTHWGVWRHEVRIGCARLTVAGVGAVATHADYRNRGLISRTARHSIDGFAAAGFDLTLLFGIPSFYHRFGYLAAYAAVNYHIDLDHLPPGMDVAFAKVGLDRRAEMDRLYNRHYADISGTVVRPFLPDRPPGGHDAARRAASPDGWYAWIAPDLAADKPKKKPAAPIAGYLAVEFEPGKLSVIEAVGRPEAIFSVAGDLARRHQCPEVIFRTLSPNTPLAHALRRLTAREIRHSYANQGPLGRVVRLGSSVQKLLPELTRRVKRHRPDLPEGPVVTLSDPRERVVLAWQEGGMRLAHAGPAVGKPAPKASAYHLKGGEAVYRLLVGSAPPAEILDTAGLRVDPETLRRLELLFPEQHPVTPRMDYF